jgi:hypothetical protein
LNIDLCDALDVNIYSFPMKYHPITDEKWFSNRNFIGDQWTRKAIRTIQAVLNSTAGKIGKGRTFFFKAFGRNEIEFHELLRMPEAFIIKRWDSELAGLTDRWRKAYSKLDGDEQNFVNAIIDKNIFERAKWQNKSATIRKVLDFYTIEREDIQPVDENTKTRHIKTFEKTCALDISGECKKLLGQYYD